MLSVWITVYIYSIYIYIVCVYIFNIYTICAIVDYHRGRPQAWLKVLVLIINYFFLYIGLKCHFNYFVLWYIYCIFSMNVHS